LYFVLATTDEATLIDYIADCLSNHLQDCDWQI
jgi:hypothetical protein